MKPCRVSAMEIGNEGGLRHPKFMGFRDDINVQDCTYEKIFGQTMILLSIIDIILSSLFIIIIGIPLLILFGIIYGIIYFCGYILDKLN